MKNYISITSIYFLVFIHGLFVLKSVQPPGFHNSAHNETTSTDNSVNPNLIWGYSGIGNGYCSPTIAQDQIFVTGEIDSMGYLFALDLRGNLLWKKQYGDEWTHQRKH